MPQNIQLFLEKLSSFFTLENLRNLFKSAQPYIQELQDFHFYFSNPVFVLLILICLLSLYKPWGLKKAFSYCLLISSILYLTTRITVHMNTSIDGGEVTYAAIIKFISIFIISVVSIYYFFVKQT